MGLLGFWRDWDFDRGEPGPLEAETQDLERA
jgi:hypothetical protein